MIQNHEERQAVGGGSAMSSLIARVVQREFSRSRSARLRAGRRRSVAQRARRMERLTLATVLRG